MSADNPTFIRVHAIPTDDSPEPIRMIVNLRNVRSFVERYDHSVLESSADSIGTVHVHESWDEVAKQVRDGGILNNLEGE